MSDHEPSDKTKATISEIVDLKPVTITLTGTEILGLVATVQLACSATPALGAIGESATAVAKKIVQQLDPNSLLAQHLNKGWVSEDVGKFEPINYPYEVNQRR